MILSKDNILKINQFLIQLSILTLIGGLFVIEGYIALSNIALGATGIMILLNIILKNRVEINIPKWFLITSFLAVLTLFVAAYFSDGFQKISLIWVKRWMIFIYSALIFCFLPKQNIKFYLAMFIVFITIVFSIDFYVLYKYYDLIIVRKGEGLPAETWVNFMDLMSVYIIPLKYTHHTLSFFNVFAVSMLVFLSKKLPAFKFVFWGMISFLFFMVHFYSSRMAVLVLYIMIIVHLYAYFKNYKWASLIIVGSIFLSAVVLYFSVNKIPTLKLKYEKLLTEIEFYKKYTYNDIKYGPEYRLKSYFIAFDYNKKYFWNGIGLGQMGSFADSISKPYPLNSYLFMSVALGVPFILLIFILHFFPLFKTNIFSNVGLIIFTLYCFHFFYSLIDTAIILPVYVKFLGFWMAALQHINLCFDDKIKA